MKFYPKSTELLHTQWYKEVFNSRTVLTSNKFVKLGLRPSLVPHILPAIGQTLNPPPKFVQFKCYHRFVHLWCQHQKLQKCLPIWMKVSVKNRLIVWLTTIIPWPYGSHICNMDKITILVSDYQTSLLFPVYHLFSLLCFGRNIWICHQWPKQNFFSATFNSNCNSDSSAI